MDPSHDILTNIQHMFHTAILPLVPLFPLVVAGVHLSLKLLLPTIAPWTFHFYSRKLIKKTFCFRLSNNTWNFPNHRNIQVSCRLRYSRGFPTFKDKPRSLVQFKCIVHVDTHAFFDLFKRRTSQNINALFLICYNTHGNTVRVVSNIFSVKKNNAKQ